MTYPKNIETSKTKMIPAQRYVRHTCDAPNKQIHTFAIGNQIKVNCNEKQTD